MPARLTGLCAKCASHSRLFANWQDPDLSEFDYPRERRLREGRQPMDPKITASALSAELRCHAFPSSVEAAAWDAEHSPDRALTEAVAGALLETAKRLLRERLSRISGAATRDGLAESCWAEARRSVMQ